jgi:putative addiction module component (TIGR02574 family)
MLADYENLRQLPTEEKLRVIEFLWESIPPSAETFTLSDADRAEIERRLAELDADPTSALTEEEFWRQVDEARG